MATLDIALDYAMELDYERRDMLIDILKNGKSKKEETRLPGMQKYLWRNTVPECINQ